MNKLFYIWYLPVLIIMCACTGEDRTYQYEALTQHNRWIYEQMQNEYLWADDLSEPAWKKFFGDASSFLTTMKTYAKSDKWSYVENDTIQADAHARGKFSHIESYGFDFTLMTDPTSQTTKQYVRVLTVYPGSPAERCGLKRGDFIMSYNGNKITSNNSSKLQTGAERILSVCHLGYDTETQTYQWADTISITLPKSEYVEDVAFPVHNVTEFHGLNVGYLMCNRLTEGATERSSADTSYRTRLDELMGNFREANISELVLDLRLCNDGSLNMAQRLASYIVDTNYWDSIFAQTFWNQMHSSNNEQLPFDTSVANLNLGRVFIITSSYTQGAAEWLIHSLQSVMGEENVVLIGQTTAGQNVITKPLRSDTYGLTLHAAVAYVGDAEGNYDYSTGIAPISDNQINEFNYITLAPYGSTQEILFNWALNLI